MKSKRLVRRRRHLDYLHIVEAGGAVLLHRRGAGDVWQGLYDLPVVESLGGDVPEVSYDNAVALLRATTPGLAGAAEFEAATAPVKTQLTHQELVLRYWRFGCPERTALPAVGAPYHWVSSTELAGLGVPQPLLRYLGDAQLGLAL